MERLWPIFDGQDIWIVPAADVNLAASAVASVTGKDRAGFKVYQLTPEGPVNLSEMFKAKQGEAQAAEPKTLEARLLALEIKLELIGRYLTDLVGSLVRLMKDCGAC